jgi:hypothetical protein
MRCSTTSALLLRYGTGSKTTVLPNQQGYRTGSPTSTTRPAAVLGGMDSEEYSPFSPFIYFNDEYFEWKRSDARWGRGAIATVRFIALSQSFPEGHYS